MTTSPNTRTPVQSLDEHIGIGRTHSWLHEKKESGHKTISQDLGLETQKLPILAEILVSRQIWKSPGLTAILVPDSSIRAAATPSYHKQQGQVGVHLLLAMYHVVCAEQRDTRHSYGQYIKVTGL